MVTQYDEKGKIFTEVISKQPLPVIIQTGQNIIHGSIHIRVDTRLKDELNNPNEHFLAVTNVTVYDLQNVVLYRCNFLVINTDQVVWVIPQEELEQ